MTTENDNNTQEARSSAAHGSENLAVGEVVRATKHITRYDGRCELATGKTATISRAENVSRPGVQIVAVRLADGNQMIDIVVENGVPLVRADSQNDELCHKPGGKAS